MENGHKAACVWLTGLSCSGKSTIAVELQRHLFKMGCRVFVLDGDNIRHGLNKDLGFSPEDRKENLRRVAHVAKLFNDNGNFVIASFVSPNDEYRKMVKEIASKFKLAFVKCRPEVCEQRDVKGMYKKARTGEIKDFTGVSAPFEEPADAEIIIDTECSTVEECVKEILDKMGIQKMAKVTHCLLGRV